MLKPSIFIEKAVHPMLHDVEAIVPNFLLWKELMQHVYENFPDVIEEWSHSGKNYGWSFRLRSKKRVVMYFVPLEDCFRVAFALGQAATDAILAHPNIPFEYKKELMETTVYREGRGLRITVIDQKIIHVIKDIIDIKMAN